MKGPQWLVSPSLLAWCTCAYRKGEGPGLALTSEAEGAEDPESAPYTERSQAKQEHSLMRNEDRHTETKAHVLTHTQHTLINKRQQRNPAQM